MRSVLLAACTLGLCLPSSNAEAKGKKHSAQRLKRSEGFEAKVHAEVLRELPKGLKIVSMSLPASLQKHSQEKDVVSLHWRSTPKAGRAVIQVLVHKKNGRLKKGWARVQLAQMETLVVANRNLVAGIVLGPGALRLEERLRLRPDEISQDLRFLVGSRVLKDIPSGHSLHSNEISRPVPISRGTPVRVEVHQGGVIASTTGVLSAKTLVGSIARVRVAGRLINGVLVRADTVVLHSSPTVGVR